MRQLLLTLVLASALSSHAQPATFDPFDYSRDGALAFDLNDALRYALQHNFAIARAREQIEAQHGIFIQARAEALPEVLVLGSYGRVSENRLNEFGPGNLASSQSWIIDVEVRQTLYSGGRITANLRAEKRLREAALLEWRSVVHDELLRVRESFYEVQLAQARIGVEEEALELLEEQLNDVQKRFDVGSAPRFDLLRARVAVANQRPELIRVRNDLRVALVELREALGLRTQANGLERLDQPLSVVGEMAYQPREYALQEVLSTARTHRVELDFLAAVEASRTEALKSQEATYLPDLDVFAGYGVEQSSFGTSLTDTLRGWRVGANLTWSLWAGWAREGRILEARSSLNQARLDTDEERLTIEVEVRRAFSDWQQAEELVIASRQVVEEAAEALRLAEARFAAGSATQLDLLEARVDLTEARTNEVEALFSHNVALAQLLRAMGIADPFVTRPEVSFDLPPERANESRAEAAP
ncbi:MAG: TolC family protein [Opitutales bacterium]